MSAFKLFHNRLALLGFIVLLLLTGLAIFGPFITLYSPEQISPDMYAKPSLAHWLGTDQIGRDVLSRLIFACRVSLMVGFGAVAISAVIGTFIGLLAGFFGGKIDMLLMRITDMFMSFPQLMLILVVVSVVGPGITNVILVMGLLGWTEFARLVRGNVLSIRNLDYVNAAVTLGVGNKRILLRHVLPNVVSPIIVQAVFGIAGAILVEASLSFIGLGVQPPASSWGNMLAEAQSLTTLKLQPWLWVPPGLMIMICVLSVNFLGDGLREALDPRAKK